MLGRPQHLPGRRSAGGHRAHRRRRPRGHPAHRRGIGSRREIALMQAIVLNAEWAPRDGAVISERDRARKWAPNANLAWRNPSMQLDRVEDPAGPGPGELLVRIEACGICGSDVLMFETDEAGYMILPYHVACPVVVGHEFAGT